MVDLKQSLDQLQEKLQLLIKRYGTLEKQYQQQSLDLLKQENQNKDLAKQLKESRFEFTASMMHKSELNPMEKEKWVKQIDQYIKEIDTAIKNLNP